MTFSWNRIDFSAATVHQVKPEAEVLTSMNYLPPHYIFRNMLLVEEQYVSNQGKEKITHTSMKNASKGIAAEFCQWCNIKIYVFLNLTAYVEYLSREWGTLTI